MSKRVSTAEAKAHLSALMAQVAEGKGHVIIEKRGKPVAALVSLKDLVNLGKAPPSILTGKPTDLLANLDVDSGITDEIIDELVELIYKDRERDAARRQAELEE